MWTKGAHVFPLREISRAVYKLIKAFITLALDCLAVVGIPTQD